MKPRTPCKTCPWRVDAHVKDIPNFELELAERLTATTTGEYLAPMMACHQSEDTKFVCAGWLARHGEDSLTVRMALVGALKPADGTLKGITPEGLHPGEDWPEIHDNYDEVLDKMRQQDEEIA